MSRRIEFKIDDNCTSWLEVPDIIPSSKSKNGMRKSSATSKKVTARLDVALDLIKSFAKKSGEAISTMSDTFHPDELDFSISLSFDAKTGLWGFAEVSAGTQISVTISWKNLKKPK